ncbi:MAG TPA: hypothetical protein VG248_06175 [Caulobacteraceae bacterium]|nr:hypothetical protein [Caulobacteraceae bacterium]
MNLKTYAAAAAGIFVLAAVSARAEQWVDYAPQKGVVVHTFAHVEPGHLDDYLIALKKTWVPEEEFLQKKGVITRWAIQTRDPQIGDGPNVVMIEWYPTMANLDADKALDSEMLAQSRAITPKADVARLGEERAKYRTLTGQDMWVPLDFPN